MRRMIGRGLRLLLIGAMGTTGSMALAATDSQATQTRLDAQTRIQTRDGANYTQGIYSVSVTGADGKAATGAVVLEDGGKQIAGAALNTSGQAQITVDLPAGNHSITAAYQGDSTHAASTSASAATVADASPAATGTGTPDFQMSVSPASLTLAQGQSGTGIVTLTPVNANALTAPMFVTVSCSGLPDQSTCNFTPENVQIEPKTTAAVTSDMVIITSAQSTHGTGTPTSSKLHTPGTGNGVALAILLPGALGLAGLAFAARKGGWSKLALIALVAFVTSMGMTACAPRYNYYNHGPPYNLPTPSGAYTVTVTAQSSNGVTATTHSTTFALTVNAAPAQ